MRVVRYRRIRVKIPDAPPLTGICDCCGKKRKTDTAHVIYAYTTKQVRENPNLAMDYTLELCYNPCHKIMDMEDHVNRADPKIRVKLSALRQQALRARGRRLDE